MISVVIITHNRESDILERAVKSVFAQTYKNIEVIIVNDSDKSFSGYQNVIEVIKDYERCARTVGCWRKSSSSS